MSNLLKTKNQGIMVEDSKKAFALFELRSRIMEFDIERGLDRKGGTVVVDDVVNKEYQEFLQENKRCCYSKQGMERWGKPQRRSYHICPRVVLNASFGSFIMIFSLNLYFWHLVSKG